VGVVCDGVKMVFFVCVPFNLTRWLCGNVCSVLLAASSRDIFGCSKNRQNRIVENSTYPLDDFGFR